MKTLYILRHAKSSWKFSELSDHDRPLNKRGRNDAPLMGKELNAQGILPKLIVSSPAVRALSTATLVAKELDYDPDDISVDERIYGADKNLLLEVVQDTPPDIDDVMIVGHNDALTDFANMLSPESVGSIPTAGIVALKFDTKNWHEINRKNAEFVFYDFPKNYE
jgi:phosphohistidine phosphatase